MPDDARAPVIAIDGPAASGKGTIAYEVARTLDFHYLDSGSLYRVIALRALQRGIAQDDGTTLAGRRNRPGVLRDRTVAPLSGLATRALVAEVVPA